MPKKLTTEDFIIKAKEVHGDKYDYSLAEYVNNTTKVKIICPIHGIFEQTPNNHLNGKGCPKCVGHNKTKNEIINEFINVHGDKYDYSLVDYINTKTKVKIICPEHGVFEQSPYSHLSGCGCPYCAQIVRSLTKKNKRLNYLEAKNIINKLQIKTSTDFDEKYDIIIKPYNIPKSPSGAYKNEGWSGWGDFLNMITNKNREFLPYNDAKQIVTKLNIKSGSEWNLFTKSNDFPLNIPKYPRSTYKNNGWVSMGDWLGTGYVNHKDRKYLPFDECCIFVRKLGFTKVTEWEEYCKSGQKPENIPSNPSKYYKKK